MAQEITAAGQAELGAEASAAGDTRLDGVKPTPARLSQLDVCRGLAILAVLFIHVSGHFLPTLHPAKSLARPTWAWYAVAGLNAASAWAVPCFLMLSAFVNAQSLARSGDIGKYARRRVQTALLPYVLWSGVYIVVNTALHHMARLTPGHVAKMLLTGTAHFHLYFFVLVLELYLLLPLLLPLFKRRPPFWAVTLAAITLQAGVYAFNRHWFTLHHKSLLTGTILWDVLPVALGLWLWSQWGRWDVVRERGKWAAGCVTLAALAVYMPLAVAIMLHPNAHVNTALYQMGQWFYTAGVSFLILGLGWWLGQNGLTRVLGFLGAESLAIYVMHPLAILALDKIGLNKHVGAGLGMAVYYAACLALPLAGAWVWRVGKKAMTR